MNDLNLLLLLLLPQRGEEVNMNRQENGSNRATAADAGAVAAFAASVNEGGG